MGVGNTSDLLIVAAPCGIGSGPRIGRAFFEHANLVSRQTGESIDVLV
jgi:hypothetical protein